MIKDLKMNKLNLLVMISVVVSIASFDNCRKSVSDRYYYGVFLEDSLLMGYEVHTIQSETRNDSTFRINEIKKYTKDFEESDRETINSVIVSGDIFYMDSNNEPGSMLISFKESGECVDFVAKSPLSDVLSYEICFTGQEDVLVDGVLHKQAYTFEKLTGTQSTHKVKSKIYYTCSFVLLLDEYLSGYSPYYRKQLLEYKPEEL